MSKPRVFIRTVEDSPSWLDQRLIAAYLSTKYWVALPDEKGTFLHIGKQHSSFLQYLAETEIHQFALITAFNPQSEILSDSDNLLRHEQLRKDLAGLTSWPAPAENISPDGSWPVEKGFFAGNLPESEAFRLGVKYGQHAIVWWEEQIGLGLWWLMPKMG